MNKQNILERQWQTAAERASNPASQAAHSVNRNTVEPANAGTSSGDHPTATAEHLLELRTADVSVGRRLLLSNLNFHVDRGDFVGLLGPNGAGKTTLLKVFLGLLPVQRGTLTVFGHSAAKGNANIGYVPQSIHLDADAPLTGRDLVGLGLDGHRLGFAWPNRSRREKIHAALQAVDALDFADARVGRLSGGQQQRLLIAQALIGRPQLLLLDEPLSNLDIRMAHEIVHLLADINRTQGIAVVLVAHDVNPLLGAMNKVLYLAGGRAAMGPVDEIIDSRVLSSLYGYTVEVLRVGGRVMVVGGKDQGGDVEDLTGCLHCDGQETVAP